MAYQMFPLAAAAYGLAVLALPRARDGWALMLAFAELPELCHHRAVVLPGRPARHRQ